jgi:hypothetical protein
LEQHDDRAGFEPKTGKFGKGTGPASFVALRVHLWFNPAERFRAGAAKHANTWDG